MVREGSGQEHLPLSLLLLVPKGVVDAENAKGVVVDPDYTEQRQIPQIYKEDRWTDHSNYMSENTHTAGDASSTTRIARFS